MLKHKSALTGLKSDDIVVQHEKTLRPPVFGKLENLRFCTPKIHFCSSYFVSRNAGFKYRADDWLHWLKYLERCIQSIQKKYRNRTEKFKPFFPQHFHFNTLCLFGHAMLFVNVRQSLHDRTLSLNTNENVFNFFKISLHNI